MDRMDLLYDLAAAMLTFMRSDPNFPVVLLYVALAGIPVTLLHELGHAMAARAQLGAEVHVSVGSTDKLAELRLGQIAMSINALSHPGRAAGSASVDDARATAEDVLWIALAGPLASLGGLVLTWVLYSAAPATGIAHDFLWAAVGTGVFGVLNLIPLEFQDPRDGPRLRTDGRLAIDALRVSRELR